MCIGRTVYWFVGWVIYTQANNCNALNQTKGHQFKEFASHLNLHICWRVGLLHRLVSFSHADKSFSSHLVSCEFSEFWPGYAHV